MGSAVLDRELVKIGWQRPLHRPQYKHEGTIYRASNFEYVGLSGKDKGFLDTETGKTYHSRALRTKYKRDYKPFVKKLREKLSRGELIPIDLPQKHCFVFRYKV